jgi:hypothetical protein
MTCNGADDISNPFHLAPFHKSETLTTQAINPVEALKLYNQVKTVPAVPVEVPMNANNPRLAVTAVA